MPPRLSIAPEEAEERKANVSKRTGFRISEKVDQDAITAIFGDFLTFKHPLKKLLAVCKDAKPAT
ncbi:hypothetical protein HDU99_002799, partial [Rhizoclosmatium hyalinum]